MRALILLMALVASTAEAQTPTATPVHVVWGYADISAGSGIGRIVESPAGVWTRDPLNPIIGRCGAADLQAWDPTGDATPMALTVGGTTFIYFGGFHCSAPCGPQTSCSLNMGMATSTDGGRHFTKYAGNPIIPNAEYPYVIYDEGDPAPFKMLYWPNTRDSTLRYVTSTDGFHWSTPIVVSPAITGIGGRFNTTFAWRHDTGAGIYRLWAAGGTYWEASQPWGPWTQKAQDVSSTNPFDPAGLVGISTISGTITNLTGTTVNLHVGDPLYYGNNVTYPQFTRITAIIGTNTIQTRDSMSSVFNGGQIERSCYTGGVHDVFQEADTGIWRGVLSCGPTFSYSGSVGGCHPGLTGMGIASDQKGLYIPDYSLSPLAEPVVGTWDFCHVEIEPKLQGMYVHTPTPTPTPTFNPTMTPTRCFTAAPFSCVGICSP